MPNAYDITWGLLVGGTAPLWLVHPKWRRKVLNAFRERMGPRDLSRDVSRPAVMIHAVSLGEINAARAMITQLANRRDDLQFIVTTTTETGYARAVELYGKDPRVTLVHYPLDFSGAIARLLDGLRPSVVVLMELEVWPNFVYQCQTRNIPVLLVNGRLTAPSFSKYRLALPVMRRAFRRLAAVCAQEQSYADRFIALGAPAERVRVTGTMKFDTAEVAERIAGDQELAEAVGLHPGEEPILVCGSTGPGEEEAILRVYKELVKLFPKLRLVIVPRHPQRFNEVAQLIEKAGLEVIRRSQVLDSAIRNPKSAIPAVVLGDTMGELRKFYSLASVVFVGRSLVDLGPRQHGSDMIEPAALAKPVVVGPWTHNFAEPMNKFRAADAVCVVENESELGRWLRQLLENPVGAIAMGGRAREIVQRERGATARHVGIILDRVSREDGDIKT